ncbi:MAG: cysteine desulfurase [Deltaproteobacteria bacterium]|nr:cysteine desulfurase [Deltaproteobacteria bacterium]
MDIEKIRKDFPILSRIVRDRPLVYLDNAATTQKPSAVIEAISGLYRNYNANVHRGVYLLAEEATQAYEDSREAVRRFINAGSTEEVVFTRNATEALNLVAYTWADANIRAGDEIIVTIMEHHSNYVPWFRLARRKGAVIKIVPSRKDGELDMDAFGSMLSDRTKLVGIAHMSNVFGTINPVREMVSLAHTRGAAVVVDGAQSAPHMKIDVRGMDCDFFALSGHKMLGPAGIGVLYAKSSYLKSMEPFMSGGEMILRVTLEDVVYNDLPWKFEAGTPNYEGAIGLKAAIEYLEALGMDTVEAYERELTEHALRSMKTVPDIFLYGPSDPAKKGGIIAFNIKGVHSHDIGTILDSEGIAIRAGHHCAQPLMIDCGVSAMARASFYFYNTEQEIDMLVKALKKAKEMFGHVA